MLISPTAGTAAVHRGLSALLDRLLATRFRGVGLKRRQRIYGGIPRIVVDVDERNGVFGSSTGLGDDRHHRMAMIECVVASHKVAFAVARLRLGEWEI